MEKSKIIGELNQLIDKGNDILKTEYTSVVYGLAPLPRVNKEQFTSWRTSIKALLCILFEKDSPFFEPFSKQDNSPNTTRIFLETLKAIKEQIKKDIIKTLPSNDTVFQEDYDLKLRNIFSKFHKIVVQLRHRHSNRDTLNVNDEYDVQDLLHSLLHIYFDDIRPEEWTPSYAGRAARTDFLLKNEKVFVEVKKTRNGLADKEVGEQLTLDIAKYRQHPDCEKLYCFVYDPESRIVNKRGIISDLESANDGFVKVIINPE